MNKILVVLLAGLFSVGVFAQAEKSRADVKKETATANAKGEIAKGESGSVAAQAASKLTKEEMKALRAMIKKETAGANKAGATAKAGEANDMAMKAEAKLSKEEMAALRAKVKAETASANKKGDIKTGEK